MTSWLTVRRWLTEEALPLWGRATFDEGSNAFAERLTLEGEPIGDIPRRLMVQARQIYSYTKAEQHGWIAGAGDLAAKAASSMVERYYQADGKPGWVMSVDHAGAIVDTTRDLYGHAFVLLGLAAAFQTAKDENYLALADSTLSFMDTAMAYKGGGYLPALPAPAELVLTQNPHMHLLEALLALYEVAPKEDYKARAAAIVSLFETSLFQASTGTLSEYFDSNWTPVEGDRGTLFEPGHHYEWIWLLRRYAAMFGMSPSSCSLPMGRMAGLYGRSKAGLLWSEVRNDGLVLDSSSRLWPHTEAIKAAVSASDDAAADMWLDLLYQSFLKPAHAGGWIDRFTEDGKPAVNYMPASSLYHLVCAFSELESFRISA